MEHITEVLKDGITVGDVLKNLRIRKKEFQKGITWSQRGAMIHSLFPDIYQEQLANAENCLNGLTILPGSANLHFIGNPVKWHENIYDYDEYSYQLNRMDHWRTMAEAYSFTGEDRFARKIAEEFLAWVEDCPSQPLYKASGELAVEDFDGCKCNQGIWRSLEVGIRMYRTWPHIIHHLIESRYIDEAFLETYLTSVYQHAQILYLVTPLLWPNADHNHYLMENNGLLYLSCMFPEFKEAEVWKKHALHEMERSINAQVTSGGGQIEGCTSYHNGCSYWFILPLLLSEKYNFSVSDSYQERLKLMAAYSTHATRPCGGNCSWGDSNTYGGTLSMGAVCHYLAFGDSSYMEYAHNYYSYENLLQTVSKYVWEAPDLAHLQGELTRIKDVKTLPQLPTVSWQKELKQVFMRTDWSTDALYLMFACRTPVQNMHAHIDPAGFEFCAYGKLLLGDPAIYYYKDDENRRNLKSAHWHNCLTLNHQNPWKYISSWEYGPQQPGGILHAEQSDRLIYAVAEHSCYQPSIHRRTVALVDKRFLLVLDSLNHVNPDTSVQINFHMDTPAAMADSEHSFARSLTKEANISVFSDSQLKPSLIPAKISTKNDVWHDTMIARFESGSISEGCHAFVTVAFPSPAGAAAAEVTDIQKELKADGSLLASFRVDGQDYRLELKEHRLRILS